MLKAVVLVSEICNNMALGILMIAAAEASHDGEALDLDVKRTHEIISNSRAANLGLNNDRPSPDLMYGVGTMAHKSQSCRDDAERSLRLAMVCCQIRGREYASGRGCPW